ncbi:hypothetical protein H072_5643 [Dactylellina haptotyla CBS 200.50]|uniref:DUF3108 domain-containing protein n=1 Tax=Dactylellina haptotyla (strain CBS 200.50) TaxID=1284197 RepID=S8BM14_DACHA|nr:hypothetical protein H072_5643 [Dactylellina haptotyla CBS 200.50]
MMYASCRLLAIIASATIMVSPVLAASNTVPDYEVKLLMNSTAVLGTDFKLTPTVLSYFGMPTTVTKMNVQFLDKSNKEIYNAGWSPRIRKTEGESDFELTYKKRYSITGGNIDAALTNANNEGFDSTDTKYDAQIEWGYQKQTLSISRQKSASGSGYSGMDLPGQTKSRTYLIDEAPDKFDDWVSNNWGTTALASARIFGPVLAKRSIGTWSGLQLYIEVWPIKDAAGTGIEYIVEASIKTTSRTTASTKQADLIALLTVKGWFLAQDSLKTQLIMDRY